MAEKPDETNPPGLIAWQIRAQLVCCHIYQVVNCGREPTGMEQQQLDRGEDGWHQSCYWGEAAALTAERLDKTSATYQPVSGHVAAFAEAYSRVGSARVSTNPGVIAVVDDGGKRFALRHRDLAAFVAEMALWRRGIDALTALTTNLHTRHMAALAEVRTLKGERE